MTGFRRFKQSKLFTIYEDELLTTNLQFVLALQSLFNTPSYFANKSLRFSKKPPQ